VAAREVDYLCDECFAARSCEQPLAQPPVIDYDTPQFVERALGHPAAEPTAATSTILAVMAPDVALRPASLPTDDEFLMSVYASTRMPELSGLGWPQANLDAFIRMQFDAQARHYAAVFPDASHSVITVSGQPAGRMIVDRSNSEIRIVDIVLLPQFRRAGVGNVLVRELLDEADERGLPVRCHVAVGNDARRFWERLGLEVGDHDDAYIAMERPCRTSPR
jgi:GNAT superfamily N-acetyltransferase